MSVDYANGHVGKEDDNAGDECALIATVPGARPILQSECFQRARNKAVAIFFAE